MTEDGARRTIHMTDDLWRRVRAGAAARDQTVSAFIEGLLRQSLDGAVAREPARDIERAFTEFRPAPKPGRKK